MRKIRLIKVLLFALLFCCFSAAPARALTIHVNNNVKEAFYMAFVYYDDDREEWMKNAWYEVQAGQTRTLEFPVGTDTIFWYAKNYSGTIDYTVPDGHPQADAQDIVNEKMFLPANDTPKGSGYKFVNFREFEFTEDPIYINLNY